MRRMSRGNEHSFIIMAEWSRVRRLTRVDFFQERRTLESIRPAGVAFANRLSTKNEHEEMHGWRLREGRKRRVVLSECRMKFLFSCGSREI